MIFNGFKINQFIGYWFIKLILNILSIILTKLEQINLHKIKLKSIFFLSNSLKWNEWTDSLASVDVAVKLHMQYNVTKTAMLHFIAQCH